MACTGTQGLVFTVKLKENNTTNEIISNRIERVALSSTFRDILELLLEKYSYTLEFDDSIQVFVSTKLLLYDKAEIDVDESIELACSVMSAKCISFTITRVGRPSILGELSTSTTSMVDVLMQSQREPKKLEEIPNKDKSAELHNLVIQDMQGDQKLLRGTSSQADATQVMKKVTSAIWYLHGRGSIINEASRKRKLVTPIPDRFSKYQGFQRWKEWKKKARLEKSSCKLHADNLIKAIEKRCILWPAQWKEDLIKMSSSLSTYAKELEEANEHQQSRHLMLHPSRTISEYAECQFLPAVAKHEVHKELPTLSDAVHDLEECVPILIEDDYFEPTITASHRLYLLSIMALADPVQLIRYDSGGGSCVMHFIQKSLRTQQKILG